jgi:glucose-1-phosphate cytidylyltransferase
MKVVIFCGGQGMRLRDYNHAIPKPMVPVGSSPILLHLMKYYAHYGHTEFILCVGWQSEVIREYVAAIGSKEQSSYRHPDGDVVLESIDTSQWKITLVDTGIEANIGQRLRSVRNLIDDGEVFLANYADGLSDLHLPDLIAYHHLNSGVATFLSVQPKHNSFHAIETEHNGRVSRIYPIDKADIWMNGGYFVFNSRIFDYIGEDQELVEEPFARLTAEGELFTYKCDGFWGCMDTFKEKEMLDEMVSRGVAPWEVWNRPGTA